MATRQLTWIQAEQLAERAVKKATGFGPQSGPLPKGTTCEDVARVMADAVVIALREAGCLAAQDAKDRLCIERAADAAKARHDAWRRATGATC